MLVQLFAVFSFLSLFFFPTNSQSSEFQKIHWDQSVYDRMGEMISEAKESIDFQMYIFGGKEAEKISELMIQKNREGIKVRIILDGRFGLAPQNLRSTIPIFLKLKNEGIDVRISSSDPLFPHRRGKSVDHNKILIIDQKQALVGSSNVEDLFLKYHDGMIEFTGSSVFQVSKNFEEEWSGRNQVVSFSRSKEISILRTAKKRSEIYPALLQAIRSSKKSLEIMVHEWSDPRLVAEVIRAHQRGVFVRVIFDPWDVSKQFLGGINIPSYIPNATTISRLQKAGVSIRGFITNDEIYAAHMKMMVVDEKELHFGSANWTMNAWNKVKETNLRIRNEKAAKQALGMFEKNWHFRTTKIVLDPKVFWFEKAFEKISRF